MTQPVVTEIDVRTASAQVSLDKLRAAFVKSGAAADRVKTIVEEQNVEFLRLAARTDDVARARLAFESAERRAGAALDAGKISAAQYNQILDGQIAKIEAATLRKSGFAGATDAATRSGRNLGQVIGQAGFQIQDFAAQVAGGQSALVAFGQQGSQLLGIFGPAGAIAGAVLTVGVLAAKLMDVKSAAERAAEDSKKLDDAIKGASDAVSAQIRLGRDLAASQEGEQRRVLDLARYYASLDKTMRDYETARLRVRRLEIAERQASARETAINATEGVRGTLTTAQRAVNARSLDDLAAYVRRATGDANAQGAQLAEALAEFDRSGNFARLYNQIFKASEIAEGTFTKNLRDLLPALQKAQEQAFGSTEALRMVDEALRVLANVTAVANDNTRLGIGFTADATVAAYRRAEAEKMLTGLVSTALQKELDQRAALAEFLKIADTVQTEKEKQNLSARQTALVDNYDKARAAARTRYDELQRLIEETANDEISKNDRLQKARAAFNSDLDRIDRAYYDQKGKLETEAAGRASASLQSVVPAAETAATGVTNALSAGYTAAANAARASADEQIAQLARVQIAAASGPFAGYAINPNDPLAPTTDLSQLTPTGQVSGFATGGEHSGGLRVVGERGPEIEATGPSRIWSFDETRRMLQGAGGGSITINVSGAGDPQAVARAVVAELNRAGYDGRPMLAASAVGNDRGRRIS